MAAKSITVKLDHTRDTKNKAVYAETGDEQHIGSLYVLKATAEKLGNPGILTVTIKGS